MEVQRQLDVLNRHLAEPANCFMCGDEYTIADMAILPWVQQLRNGYCHEASGRTTAEFLGLERFGHVLAWADRLLLRPAVQRGMMVRIRRDQSIIMMTRA